MPPVDEAENGADFLKEARTGKKKNANEINVLWTTRVELVRWKFFNAFKVNTVQRPPTKGQAKRVAQRWSLETPPFKEKLLTRKSEQRKSKGKKMKNGTAVTFNTAAGRGGC